MIWLWKPYTSRWGQGEGLTFALSRNTDEIGTLSLDVLSLFFIDRATAGSPFICDVSKPRNIRAQTSTQHKLGLLEDKHLH